MCPPSAISAFLRSQDTSIINFSIQRRYVHITQYLLYSVPIGMNPEFQFISSSFISATHYIIMLAMHISSLICVDTMLSSFLSARIMSIIESIEEKRGIKKHRRKHLHPVPKLCKNEGIQSHPPILTLRIHHLPTHPNPYLYRLSHYWVSPLPIRTITHPGKTS